MPRPDNEKELNMSGLTTTITCDEMSRRLLSMNDSDKSVRSCTYNILGKLIGGKDAKNKATCMAGTTLEPAGSVCETPSCD